MKYTFKNECEIEEQPKGSYRSQTIVRKHKLALFSLLLSSLVSGINSLHTDRLTGQKKKLNTIPHCLLSSLKSAILES